MYIKESIWFTSDSEVFYDAKYDGKKIDKFRGKM